MADWSVAAGKQYDMQPPWQLEKDNKHENELTVDAYLKIVLFNWLQVQMMPLDADDKTIRVERECESEEPKSMAKLMTPTCGVLTTVPTLEQQSLVMQQTAMMVPLTVVTLPQVATSF